MDFQCDKPTWGDIRDVLASYGVANADTARAQARSNGLTADQCMELVTAWNSGGKKGGPAALCKIFQTATPGSFSTFKDAQEADTFDRNAEHRAKRALADIVFNENDDAKRAADAYRSRLHYLEGLHGQRLDELDDEDFWLFYETVTGKKPTAAQSRRWSWTRLPLMEHFEAQEG